MLAGNFLMGWFAWGRQNRALRPKGQQTPPVQFPEPNYVPAASETAALPPTREGYISVTDSTTELLDPIAKGKEPVSVESRRTLDE